MADQDHGLDDVRELARGLRENEEHGPDDGEPEQKCTCEATGDPWPDDLDQDPDCPVHGER